MAPVPRPDLEAREELQLAARAPPDKLDPLPAAQAPPAQPRSPPVRSNAPSPKTARNPKGIRLRNLSAPTTCASTRAAPPMRCARLCTPRQGTLCVALPVTRAPMNASAAFSASHYSCKDNACYYTGCDSDDQCKTSTAGGNYHCIYVTELGHKSCKKACGKPSDCPDSNTPAFDASRWQCTDSLCVYIGCPSDAACSDSFNDDRYICR